MAVDHKRMDVNRLQEVLKPHRHAKKRIVFTNGCFDILHVGHIRYLDAAKALGDILVVGLNSNASVNRIKGGLRPINSEADRAEVLAALACVDYIVVFEEADPLNLIRKVAPDVLVKGADWEEERIVGAEIVKRRGGQVVRVPVVPDISTTKLIEKILEVHSV